MLNIEIVVTDRWGSMTSVNDFAEKWVLIIDDMEGMRSQLRMSLFSSGFGKLHVVASIKDALERMSSKRYDVILCDYALGDSTNGQQFLEYLRTNDLITRNTIFVMITAEQSYEKVVMASECAPDDYLLKPFTAAQFNARLEKLLEKQEYFLGLDKATDTKNWKRVIEECDKRLAVKDKFFLDLCKIKGAALLRDGLPSEAADLYREVIALRPIGWARLGLARALVKQGKEVDARILLREILADSPQFMAAYDYLGKLLVSTGDKHEALEVLQKARSISPGTMSRLREMSTIAVSAGKPEVAEAVMRQALQQHKYSPVRQVNDYALLSKALLNQGKATEALNVVADARNSFKDEHSNIVLSATESVAYRATGNQEKAEEALSKAMAGADLGKLPMHAIIAMADACFVMGKEDDAKGLLRHAIQNSHEDDSIKGKVHDVLAAAGKGALEAAEIIEQSEQEVILINNNGVRKADAGQLEEAITSLCEAAERLPNNMQIVGNACLVMALDLVRNGSKPDRLTQCLRYREMLVIRFPNNPKLVQINGLLKQLKQ